MRCDRFREAASARLDAEPLGMPATVLEAHLTACANCARWVEQATRLTRQARLHAVDVPDLTISLPSEVVPGRPPLLRRPTLLRAGLFLAGVAQVGIALPDLLGVHMTLSMHTSHEAAAWNLALGAAFLATAAGPRRAAGLIPPLLTFVVLLIGLSAHDLATGVASVARVSTHVAAFVGLLLVLALDRSERAVPPRPFPVAAPDEPGEPGLRGVA